MTLLRSVAFNLVFWGWTAVMVIGCLPVLILPGRWSMAAQAAWGRGSIAIARGLVGIRYEERGKKNLPDGPCILAIKHQSTFETIAFNFLVYHPAIVLKKELLSIPFYGWYARRAGMIPIDRKGTASTMRQMLRTAEAAVADGRPIVIFPEGTRTPAGTAGQYHPGIAGLYRHLKVPVVPVALNSGVFWPRRTIKKFPGTIILDYLPPVAPGLDRRAFMAELQGRIETASLGLLKDTPVPAVEKPVDNPVNNGD
ncbi:MAG: lysophospholipid acyltransferase family protein [Alphaproteobacteria bacterium]